MLFLCRKVPEETPQNLKKGRRYSAAGNAMYIVNLFLMLLGLAIILLVTFVRRESSVHQVILIPLRVLFGKKVPGDYWHVTVMNVVLYVPFACGLAFCVEGGRGRVRYHPVLTTILICLVLSIAVEMLQYFLGSGLAEFDDVLMNTLGGAGGCLPHIICRLVQKRKSC